MKKRKKIVYFLIFSIVLLTFVSCIHPTWLRMEMGYAYTPTPDDIVSGDGSYESPYVLAHTPKIKYIEPIKFFWESENVSKKKLIISKETGDIGIQYFDEYGYGVELQYRFIYGTPWSMKYELSGAENKEKYIVEINWFANDLVVCHKK